MNCVLNRASFLTSSLIHCQRFSESFASKTVRTRSSIMSSHAFNTRRSARRQTVPRESSPDPEMSSSPNPQNEPSNETERPPPPTFERQIKRIRIKNFPVEGEAASASPRSAFSVPEGSEAASTVSHQEEQRKRKLAKKAKKLAAKLAQQEDGDGKRRRKRKILDWTPEGPTEGEEVPSHDEEEDDDEYDPDFDDAVFEKEEEEEEEEEDDDEEVVIPQRVLKNEVMRTAHPPANERILRIAQRRTTATPNRRHDFKDMPAMNVEFDDEDDPNNYDADNNAPQDDGRIHIKFNKKRRTISDYGCYQNYDDLPTSKHAIQNDAFKRHQPKLAHKRWMSKYAMIPGQSTLVKML